MQVFSQKHFELLLCLFSWRADDEPRIFFLKNEFGPQSKTNYPTSRKGLNPKLMLQSRITSKLLFSGRNNKINTFLSLKYRLSSVELSNQWIFLSLLAISVSTATQKKDWCPLRGKLTCWVVARQYSAVLRMLQMRQSSSKVNFATSEPSFSFSKLVMVSPPLLLVVLEKKPQTTDKTCEVSECTDTQGAKLLLDFNAIKKAFWPQSNTLWIPTQNIKPTTAILGKEFLLQRALHQVFKQRTTPSLTRK